jgi:hypothetical protein
MTVPTISIDLDVKCLDCKQGGATQSGYCLKCVGAHMKDGLIDETAQVMQDVVGKAIFGKVNGSMNGETMSTANVETEKAVPFDLTLFPVPDDSKFAEAEDEFISAPDLKKIFNQLVKRYADFDHLNPDITDSQFTVTLFWKRKGGDSGGQAVFGKCIRPTQLLKHYVQTNYVIWIAADNTRGRFNQRQMQALLFHEMLHTSVGEKGEPATTGHDFEGFVREIEEFGTWRKDIEPLAMAFAGMDQELPF